MSRRSPNTSSAVMAQRHEAHDSLDDFPTPPWAARALCRHVILPAMDCFDPAAALGRALCWEPAANRGYLVRGLRDWFGRIHGSDVHDYGAGFPVVDFLDRHSASGLRFPPGWIVTNPPFRLAAQFAARAFEVDPYGGVALLVRTAFLEGIERWETLFRGNPPSIVAQFAERVPMKRGGLDPKGSTATAYCWLVWMAGEAGTRLAWIPPCRRALERYGDYLPVEAAVVPVEGTLL